MAIQGIQQNPSLRPDTGFQGAPTVSAEQKEAVPILGGVGVTFDDKTDFEKLISEMQMKNQEQREKMFASRFAAAMAVLAGRHDLFSVQQQAAFMHVSAASEVLARATGVIDELTTQLSVEQSALAILNQKLEALLESQIKTPEEREKEIKTAEEIEEKSEVEALEEEIEAKEEESAEIQELRQQIADQEKKIGQIENRLKVAIEGKGKAAANLSEALAALDAVGLQYVVNTVIASLKEIVAAAAEQPDGAEKKEKINPIIAALSEYVDKIQEMQDEELEELIAKIEPVIVMVSDSSPTVDPTVFPEYEKHV